MIRKLKFLNSKKIKIDWREFKKRTGFGVELDIAFGIVQCQEHRVAIGHACVVEDVGGAHEQDPGGIAVITGKIRVKLPAGNFDGQLSHHIVQQPDDLRLNNKVGYGLGESTQLQMSP